MDSAISVTGLGKSFGRTRALDGLDLDVRTGEVHGRVLPPAMPSPAARAYGVIEASTAH